MDCREKDIYNQLQTIESIEEIIRDIKDSKKGKIRLKIETEHWYGYDEPFIKLRRHKLDFKREILLNILEDILKERKDKLNQRIY